MKNLLITGVSRGLGLKIAELALQNGYKVFGISKTKTIELDKLLFNYKNNLSWCSIDLQDIKQNYKKILSDFIGKEKIDGAIFNAAIAYTDLVTNLNLEQLLKMYNVNVFSNIILSKFIIRNMLLNKISGSLVYISSISTHVGYKGLSMYASTKGALEAFSKSISREWGEIGIRSNCIVIGFMETDMSSSLSEEQKSRIFNRTSLRKPTDIRSVAKTALFLISDDSESITGQNIIVDSGSI